MHGCLALSGHLVGNGFRPGHTAQLLESVPLLRQHGRYNVGQQMGQSTSASPPLDAGGVLGLLMASFAGGLPPQQTIASQYP